MIDFISTKFSQLQLWLALEHSNTLLDLFIYLCGLALVFLLAHSIKNYFQQINRDKIL